VVDAVTGAPLKGASVQVTRSVLNRQEYYGWGKTDKDGVYALRLPANEYDLRPGYAEGYVYDQSVSSPADKVTVVDGQETQAPVVKLTPGADIRARVLTRQGRPAVDIQVDLTHGVRPYGFSEHTSAAGEAVFRGERPGNTVDVSARNDEGTLVGEQSFAPRAGADNEVVITLREVQPCSVMGKVVDESGRPVVGAWVVFFQPTGDRGWLGRYRERTAADGTFAIRALQAVSDSYVCAEAAGYGDKNSEHFSLASGEAHDVGVLAMVRMDQEVTGIVVDIDGEPVPDAHVSARGATKQGYASAETGKDGRFHLTKLPNDTIEVQTYLVEPQTRIIRHQMSDTVPAGTTDVRLVMGIKQKAEMRLVPKAGEIAPELVLEEGAGVTLAQFKGKPVVLAFVSIYSRPCVKVLDDLKALQAEKGADKLGVIAVHDRTATPEEIEQFRKDHSITFPIVRVPDGPRDGWDSATFRAYGVTALPTVARIDTEGKVESVGASLR
jgi:peroxiredoxin/5-hydroxyisourate hydrolase-like protein (transthyretin family)